MTDQTLQVRYHLCHWKALRKAGHLLIPVCWREWLLDSGSLTQRLKQRSHGLFSVEVLQQSWLLPNRSEQQLLSMKTRQRALIREVFLHGNNQPWVFARSVIPATTLSGRERALLRLSNRPLGEFLFSHPAMERGPIEVSRLPGTPELWARRSVFYLSGKPLMVCEVFLPDLNTVH